ncbi:AMIN-like domain-containing (lipo)protein [Streptomyces exfoliatus]|uniref:AMIN-like domain-containing (lipo)protein n=1 Tax=Streptomyces exfoliatus TaxID=1905 RepID=UPI003C2FF4A4
MHHRHTLAAFAAGILLTAGIGATIPAGATDAPSRTSSTQATALVVNARWGGHATFDRLVIDVRGAMPPVTVHQVGALHYDGSGQKVPLAGKYFLEIRLSPAAAHDDAGKSVYQGPRLLKIYLPALKGVALTGDFEGVVTIGAAFDTKPAYKTFRLHSPERFVVDIAHPVGCRA